MADHSVLKLVREYENQYKLYNDILTAARRLHSLCTEADFRDIDNINSLNELLELRHCQMQNIEKSQLLTAVLLESMKTHLSLEEINITSLVALCPSPETTSLEKLTGLLDPMLREIVSLDASSRTLLNIKLSSLKEDALKLQQGRNASKAYKPEREQYSGVFIDNKQN